MAIMVRAIGGGITITADVPVFIGSTSSAGFFPSPGDRMYKFFCNPDENTAGYLVFDHEDVERRTPTSPTFIYFERKGPEDKAVCREGLRLDRSVHGKTCGINSQMGLVYSDPTRPNDGWGTHYYTSGQAGPSARRVGILDLLRFIEGRITLEELDSLVIK